MNPTSPSAQSPLNREPDLQRKIGVIIYALLTICLWRSGPYLLGRFFDLGLTLLPLVGIPVLYFTVVCLWRCAQLMIRRRQFLRPLAALALLGMAYFPRPSGLPSDDAFLIGFRHRIYAHLTHDSLRTMADAVRAIARQQPEKNTINLSPNDPRLRQIAGLASLHAWSARVLTNGDRVSLDWGSGLQGHWGVIVHSGPPPVSEPENGLYFWAVERDITLFYGI